MRDHHQGLPRREAGDGALDLILAFRVGEGGGLVEDHYGSILQNGASEGHALPLPARQLESRRTRRGIQPLGQPGDEIVAARCPRRLLHLVVARRGVPEPDVLPDARVEEVVVLGDEAHEPGELLEGHVAHVDAPDGDAAAVDVPMPYEKAGESRFSGSGRADERRERPARHIQGHPVQNLFALSVGEADVLQLDGRVLDPGSASVDFGKFRQTEELRRVGHGVLHGLQFVDERCEPGDRIDDGQRQHHAHRQIGRRQGPAEVESQAGGHHPEERRRHDGRHQVHGHPGGLEPLHREALEGLDRACVLLVGVARLVERLHHLDALDVLDYDAVHVVALGHERGVFGVELLEARGEDGEPQRHAGEARQGHPPVDGREPSRQTRREDERAAELGDHVRQGGLDVLDSVEDDALDAADALRLDRPQGGVHELAREILPKRFQDRISRNVGQQGGRPEKNFAHDVGSGSNRNPHQSATPGQRTDDGHLHQAVHRVERDEPGRHAGDGSDDRKGHPPLASRRIGEERRNPRPPLGSPGNTCCCRHSLTPSGGVLAKRVRASPQLLSKVYWTCRTLLQPRSGRSVPIGQNVSIRGGGTRSA